ncbi:acylglycerol kinase family protein [Streptomyces roseirectus]|uniref:acylglycerol kinase family protein n=1 Tax=Streptomyces roseirectus TaxID=2768066 RepID=UPI001FE7F9CA|nr:acylglycerol kinase family protein [Streptomyces roseirectus]
MSDQLLVVIDPVARKTDGESVRIVKDVLSAGAATKVCLPEDHDEFARALTRRGSRRPVVVGDDRALLRAVSLLHRRRELDACVLSVVPVGGAVSVARSLGIPTDAVAAARAVLDGVERRVDVLVDESDGVVVGALRIPPGAMGAAGADGLGGAGDGGGAGRGGDAGGGEGGEGRAGYGGLGRWGYGVYGAPEGDDGGRGAGGYQGPRGTRGPAGRQGPWATDRQGPGSTGITGADGEVSAARRWRRTCSSLVRALVPSREGPAPAPPGPFRLRVEVDGKVLVDLDQPLEAVSVTPGASGTAAVEVRPASVGAEASPLVAYGGVVTVSGGDFRYGADAAVAGPVRTRTWRVREGALGVVVPGAG